MALSIKDPEAEALIRRLAEIRKTTLTGAIRLAVNNELARDDAARQAEVERKRKAIREIQERFAQLPVTDPTVNADDWMYDENGLPH